MKPKTLQEPIPPKSYTGINFRDSDKKYCDIVMKGGVTSGIIYPPIILELAQRYRFCNIGGTSAGAIAAAITAAAEAGRGDGGFEGLNVARSELGTPGFLLSLFQPSRWGAPLLYVVLDLVSIRHARNTIAGRPAIVALVVSLVQVMLFVLRLMWSCMRRDPLPFAIGLVGVGALRFWLFAQAMPSAGWWVVTAGLAVLAGLAVCFVHLIGIVLWLIYRQSNFFGLCSGLSTNGAQPGLVDWLSIKLDTLSGQARQPLQTSQQAHKPLTFQDLAEVPNRQPITLKMVTTNLSHHQPYLLPFEVDGFLFKEDELRQFFPDYVVQYMADLVCENATFTMPAQSNGQAFTTTLSLAELNAQLGLGKRYHFLPKGTALPVIVAVRMSLSFPILFKAVPLWSIKSMAGAAQNAGAHHVLVETDLQRHLFSDGGIASNFPIHFFDAWLPTHPTFGINLTELPKEAFSRPAPAMPAPSILDRLKQAVFPEAATPPPVATGEGSKISRDYFSTVQPVAQSGQSAAIPAGAAATAIQAPTTPAATDAGHHEYDDAVYLPNASDVLFPAWQPIPSLIAYVRAMILTMMNYHDNTQSMLPGYRERIVHIRLNEADGEGGLHLNMPKETINAIDGKGVVAGAVLSTQFNFEHHQWVRFRVLMAQLEEHLCTMRAALADIEPVEVAQQVGSTATITNGSGSFTPAGYRELIKSHVDLNYPFPAFTATNAAEWRTTANERIKALNTLLQVWDNTHIFTQNPPTPVSKLRITPDL